MIEITPFRQDDRSAWQPLAVGYNTFYERTLPDATYDHVWRRLIAAKELHRLAARLDGRGGGGGGRGARARLPALRLADAAAQRPRPRPLRQGRALRRLHPLRLPAERAD